MYCYILKYIRVDDITVLVMQYYQKDGKSYN